MSLSRSVLAFLAASALVAAVVPAIASAQVAPYSSYYGCNTYQYSTTYPYNTYPYNYNNSYCPPQGIVFVYLQVNAPANSFYGQPTGNFTMSVSGGNAFPATFVGSANGQLVSVLGAYTVTAATYQGFTPSYSSGCTGSVSVGQQASCVITENPVYPANYSNNYPYNYQYPQQYPYNYTTPGYNTTPTVYVTPTYIPRLPNTGFEPQNGMTWAFALVALVAAAIVSLRYVRKALAVILG